jgi:hypothetical protein
VRRVSYPIDDPRSHLVNRADHCAGFDRSAIHHHHAGQNACGRRLEFVREIISIDLDNGLADADRIANALEPSPDSQVRGTCNLRYLYFRALCFVHFFTFGPDLDRAERAESKSIRAKAPQMGMDF